ncbi:MAG: hypothetical protein PUB69_04090 [Desulfovibrionaceae bacterium]|nr:hypothetical protein [Desulfovibrionaceae bacterium]
MYSRFGTTSDMVIQTVEEAGQELLLAIDDKGLYLTTSKYLDKTSADPSRYTGARANVAERLTALGLDPVALFNDNKDKIQRASADAKKVNPLKASKRNAH